MNPIWFVGAGPGDPELITVKGKKLLDRADLLIYAGSLVNPELVSQSPASHKYDSNGMSLEEMTPLMIAAHGSDKTVVRLHSGDPSLYGAIIEQMELLRAAGIPCEVIPGVSSLFGAAAALQSQLTLRGVSESVIITRPAGKTLESDHISDYSKHGETMAVFLGSDRLSEVLEKVSHPRDTPAVVIYHATWPDQKIIRGTVADIAKLAEEAGICRSALLLIGEVFGTSLPGHIRSDLYS
ncbi:MAG TPA: precorrin-4 C(11)-methyltransferase [Methanospirillum sp.]|nr:precorrin-4 C(11)-methyltransferase [Methanospirillum sp.]